MKRADQLRPQPIFYNDALPLTAKLGESRQHSDQLFTYLQPQKHTVAFLKKQAWPISSLPDLLLPQPILQEGRAYANRDERGLKLWVDETILFQLARDQIRHYHLYARSRYYRNHLHVVTKDRLSLFILTHRR